ncbi:MAG: AAA family ATPase [Nitrososphaerales archaeon]
MENASDFLKFYLSRGLTILPLERESKTAILSDWPNRSREDLFKHFEYLAEFNIGLRLDGLIALDIEKPEIYDAIFKQPVDEFAKITWIQRTGKGYHILFRGHAKPFKVEGFVEIRSGNGQYIVVAPSIHPETKKPYQWISDIKKTPIAEISNADLERLRHKLETLKRFRNFIGAMVECWKRYHRHFLSLWCSGVFRKMGLPFEDALIILTTIVKLAGDEEVEDRLRCLRDTYQKPLNEIKAWSGLKDELVSITGSEEEVRTILKSIPIQKGLLFEVKSLRELIEGAKDIDYISYPLLPRGVLIILAGRGGVGKSMLCLYIAHEVSRGGKLFGLYECEQTKVLISDNENSPSIYKARVEALGLNPLDNLNILSFSRLRLDAKGAISRLKTLIKTNGYSLVILDNWTTHVSHVEENKAVEVSNILSMLRKTAYETGCTILLVHHLRKGLPFAVHETDELRGSSVLVNESDMVLLLERDQLTPARLILKTVKNRVNGESPSLAIFRKTENGIMSLIGEPLTLPETETNIIKIAKNIFDFFQVSNRESLSAREIIEALPYPRSEIYRAINYLLSLKTLERTSRGVYRLTKTIENFINEES